MDQIKIGQYIADKRKAQGLTQEQLAQKLSKSQKAVSKWERGVCLPDVSVYTELCDILGITLNEFFSGEDIEPAKVAVQSEKNLLGVAVEGEKHEGTVALIPDMLSSNEIKMILAANESRIETGMEIESELPKHYENYSTSFTWQNEGIIKVNTDEEIPLGILYVSNDESDTFPGVAGSYEDTMLSIKDAGIDYTFLFTVKFGVD